MALLTLSGVLAVTTIPAHALLLRRRPEDLGLYVDGDPTPPDHQAASRHPVAASVSEALREPAFRWLALAFSLSTIASIAVAVHMVAYFQDRGFDLTLAATATGLIGAMQVLGRIVLGLIGDRAPLRVTSAIVLGLQPIAILVLLVTPGIVGVFAFIALFGAAKGAMTLIRPAFIANLYGRERYASIAGALAAFVLGATALAPISAGLAYDLLHSYDPLFWAFVVLSAVPAGAVLLARR
jgi:cyanate permease